MHPHQPRSAVVGRRATTFNHFSCTCYRWCPSERLRTCDHSCRYIEKKIRAAKRAARSELSVSKGEWWVRCTHRGPVPLTTPAQRLRSKGHPQHPQGPKVSSE